MKYDIEYIRELKKLYGTPLYLFRKMDFIDNYKSFMRCMEYEYPKHKIAYSYKTNYTPAICKIVRELGGYAEVVSDMEYWVAKRLGYDDSMIIYNGPYKGISSLQHILNGGIVNIDNLEEVRKVCDLANINRDAILKVGLRVNIDIGQKFTSRFGIDANSDDIDIAFKLISVTKNLSVAGLHCHIGQSRTIQAWKNRINVMLKLADKYFSNPPEYIDIGSGMYAKMNPYLAKQFAEDIPTYEEYSEAITKPFAEHYKNISSEKKPILFTEPGTTLINSYVDFIGSVDSIKYIKGNLYVTLNCSKDNIGDICKTKQLPIQVISAGNLPIECKDAKFVGYTCLEHDVLYQGFSGQLAVGDFIIFENVGGYSNVSKPPFINPNCGMVELGADYETRVIKRKETSEDVFITYTF